MFKKRSLLDLKAQIDPSILTVGDFSTPVTAIVRLFKQKINKEILELIAQ
jgi:hypothetical protein